MIIIENEGRRASKPIGHENVVPLQSRYPGFRPNNKRRCFPKEAEIINLET